MTGSVFVSASDAPTSSPLAGPRKLLALAVVVLSCAAAVGSYFAYAVARQKTSASASQTSVTALLAVPDKGVPHVLYRSTALDETHGKVGLKLLNAQGDATRHLSALRCERVHYAAGRGVCLQADRGVVTTYRAATFDRSFGVLHTQPLAGLPSRVRVSADGRWAGMTVFISGHSYASASFSTRTSILDMTTGQWMVEDLEKMTVLRDGAVFKRSDFNFWGVTFISNSPGFYATLHTSGQFLLVQGDLHHREMRVVAQDVECPSLSPDQTRVAFKRRQPMPGGGFVWRLSVIELATGKVTVLGAETRNVDDQVEWLNDEELAYELPVDPHRSRATSNVWGLRADGNGQPRLVVARGASPSASR
jgi:hypothetical protein